MKITVPLFSQRAEPWQGHILGTGSTTIGGYGCLITCISMLAKYYGKDTDPDRMNNSLKAVNGYLNGNLYKWYEGVTKVYSDIVCTKIVKTPDPVTPTQWSEMKAELDAGRPVILFVDFKPETAEPDMHFVLLIGYEGDTYYVADPWYGDIANLTRYGNPSVTVNQYVFHTGPKPVNSDTVAVPKADFERLVTKATTLDNQNPSYDVLKNENQDMRNQIKGMTEENQKYKVFVMDCSAKLDCGNSTSEVSGKLTELLEQEQSWIDTKRKNEELTRQLNEATGTVTTANTQRDTAIEEKNKALEDKRLAEENEQKMKEQVDPLIKAANDLKTQVESLQEELRVLKQNLGTPGQFSKGKLLGYLLTNWFGKDKFATE